MDIVLLSATFSFALFILFIAYAFSALKFSKEESATKSLNLVYEADWRRLGLKNRSNPSQTTLPKATFNVLYQPEPPVIKQPDALLIWLRPLIEVVLASQIGSGILPAVGKFGGNRLGRIVPIFFTLFVAVLPHLCTCAILPYIDLYLHVIWTHREKKHHKEVWYRHAPFSGPLFQEGLWAFMGSDIGITPAIRILFFVMLFFIQFHIVALYMLVLLDSLEEYLLPLWKRALTQSKCIFRMTLSFSLCALMYLLTLPLNFSGLLAFHALGDLLSNASSILKFSIIRAVANRKFGIYHFDKRAVVLGWLISATPILVGLLAGLFHTIVTSDGSFTVRLNYLFSGRKSQRMEARSNHDLLATGTIETVQPTDELLVENKPEPTVRSWYESYEEAVSKSATLPLVRTAVPPHPSATLPRIKENYV
ncbi:DgyrCDS9731 [Dimorphilus gyrociliatus]|uniref:DgyrCDS9731 n=1 Tax=Dimorphilus gyrociliatus TaxID=2664684 RepID=A0A7I8W0K2_9ANNE|nr:DgyrCDS9731 [Dimorphilus gyrociliatus]